jgi:hypothetical protein
MKYLLPLLAAALLLGGALPKDFTAQDALQTRSITVTQYGLQFGFQGSGYYVEFAERATK